MKQHIMLIPSLACPAGCRYCFGPRQGKATMSLQTLEAAIRCLGDNSNGRPIDITFHGGEPLLAEVAFYRRALPLLREKLGPHNLHLGVQSNLWLLTDELCELFKEHEVTLGTSLDGPEEINDAQRDLGYFQKTMTGIERARSHGLSVGVICTFTAQSAKRAGEVFDFFLREALGFSIHAALPPLGRYDNDYTLSPEEHGRLLVGMLDRYLDNSSSIRISTLDAMCRGISAGKGSICVFGDCLGHYLAVDPDGYLYPCQRLAGMEAFRLGNVRDCPAREDLEKAPVWHAFKERQQQIDKTCSGCPHLAYCRGGCPYNVRAAGGGRFNGDLRDPHCHAYRSTFDRIIEGALAEFFSEENLSAVVAEGGRRYGLLRRGKLLQLVRGGPHPQEAARQARQGCGAGFIEAFV